MIIKTYINKNLYGKYFLATEAPDDETVTEEQPKQRRNVKVISVKPSNRRKDFTDIDENEPETSNITPTEEETPSEQNDTDETDGPDTGDDTTDFSDGASADTPAEEQPTDESDGPDTGDDTTDFSDGASADTPASDTGDNNDSNASNNKLTPPGVELDSTRKYNLFKEYMSLYNACDNYISKLENILKNDFTQNQIIRISVNNLREIKDILSDYMTIRFQLNTYIQSLLFYQKMVVAIQLVFNLLKSFNTKSV